MPAPFLRPVLENPQATFRLVNRRTGKIVAHEVFTAFDSASRRKGLLGRDSIASNSAIIIAPTNAIHTWFMRFDIDVAFVARDGTVVKARHQLKPWRVFGALGAYAALELPAGSLASSDTLPGDFLVLESTPEVGKVR